MKVRRLKLPSVDEIEAAIRERRGEIAELRELLRLAKVRELAQAAFHLTPSGSGKKDRE